MEHIVIPVITRKDFSSGNPGDVFICLGMQYLFEDIIDGKIDWFYFNKFAPADFTKHQARLKEAGFCIYAGTPQYNNYDDWCLWYDWPMWQEYIIPLKLDFYSIAGGAGFPDSEMSAERFTEYCLGSRKTRSILNSRGIRTKGVTVRDKHAHALLNAVGFKNTLLPCTATWSTKFYNLKKKPNKYIALVPPNPDAIAPHLLGLNSKKEVETWMVSEWIGLQESYRVEAEATGCSVMIVCHGQKEYELLRSHTDQIYYTNDCKSLLDFYTKCSLVIGARLHAVLPAYGVGKTKTVLIKIDTRGSSAEHFSNIPIVPLSQWSIANVRSAATEAKAGSMRELNCYKDKYTALFKEWFGDLIWKK